MPKTPIDAGAPVESCSPKASSSSSEAAPPVGGGAAIGRNHLSPPAGPGSESPGALLTRRVMQASLDLDPVALRDQLDLAATLLGLTRCVDEIVVPAARQLRGMIATGQRDAAQGLLATEAIRAWLNQRASFAPPPQDMGPILLACGPRDRDLVGLEALALLLRFRRRPCLLLGARTSTFTLTIAAQAADATAVVVFSADSRGRPQAIVSVRAVDALRIPVFFCGDAFRTRCDRRQLPGRYLGPGVQRACALLINTLAPAGQRQSAATATPGSSAR